MSFPNGRIVYYSEEDRIRDQFPREYGEGWRSKCLSKNPYTEGTDQFLAFNIGSNDRCIKEDE